MSLLILCEAYLSSLPRIPVRRVAHSVILYSLHNCPPRPLIQTIQRRHIILIELESVEIRICLDTRWGITFRQRDPVLLQAVSDQHLAGRLVVFLGDANEVLFVGFVVADERAVGLDDDVVVAAVFDNFALLVPGVELQHEINNGFLVHSLGCRGERGGCTSI